MNKEGTWLSRVWQRLFSDVGQVFTPEFVQEDNWFTKHTWTEERERAYQEWFVRTAMEDLHLPKHLAVSKSVRMLGLYGWTVDYRKSDPLARNPIHRKHLAGAEGGRFCAQKPLPCSITRRLSSSSVGRITGW